MKNASKGWQISTKNYIGRMITMKLKKLLALSLVAVMGMSIVACGSSATESAAPAEDNGAAAEAPAKEEAASGDVTEVELWHYFDASADAKAIVDWVDEYNSLQNDIHITATYWGRERQTGFSA